MASWLASQLQKAENLLEAVDRTVSSATGQQVKGPVSGMSVGQLACYRNMPRARMKGTSFCRWTNCFQGGCQQYLQSANSRAALQQLHGEGCGNVVLVCRSIRVVVPGCSHRCPCGCQSPVHLVSCACIFTLPGQRCNTPAGQSRPLQFK